MSGISGGVGEMDYNGVSPNVYRFSSSVGLARNSSVAFVCSRYRVQPTKDQWRRIVAIPFWSCAWWLHRLLPYPSVPGRTCVALPVRTLSPSFLIPRLQLPVHRLSPSRTVVASSVRTPSFELSGGGAVELPCIFFACWHLLTSRLPELTTILSCPRNFCFLASLSNTFLVTSFVHTFLLCMVQ